MEREQKQEKKNPNPTTFLGQLGFADWQQSGWYKGEKFSVTEKQVRGKPDFTEIRCCGKTVSI